MQRNFNALLGLAVGLFTWPLALVAWPLFLAWFLWNETDEDEVIVGRAKAGEGCRGGT